MMGVFDLFVTAFLLLMNASSELSPVLGFGGLKTVTVDLKGNGTFTSIQEAIDSVPEGNQEWIKIFIKAGVYSEKVNLPANKGHLVFEGEGVSSTIIQWDDHYDVSAAMETPETATFTSAASDVVFKKISFKNTFNKVQNLKIAVAMLVSGDKTSFYECSFMGVQDTLCDLQGRHYFKDCQIEGAVDFIFGYGQSIYEGCRIITSGGLDSPGWVTAHGRFEQSQPTGFVFKNCKLMGSSKVYLGRAWGRYSRVIFYNTYMEDIVVPQGWDSWKAANKGLDTDYGEYCCTGPGANTKGRVPWEKKLDSNYVQKLTSISFIDDEGWLIKQEQ